MFNRKHETVLSRLHGQAHGWYCQVSLLPIALKEPYPFFVLSEFTETVLHLQANLVIRF